MALPRERAPLQGRAPRAVALRVPGLRELRTRAGLGDLPVRALGIQPHPPGDAARGVPGTDPDYPHRNTLSGGEGTMQLTEKGKKLAEAIREFAKRKGLDPMGEWDDETNREFDRFLTDRGLI